MKPWLTTVTEYAVTLIDGMALVVILVGSAGAFLASMRLAFGRSTGHARRQVWLSFSRWLVAGLTFQLAADILETSLATDWASVGRLAAIAVIRTFLNFFLERDLAEVRDHDASTATYS